MRSFSLHQWFFPNLAPFPFSETVFSSHFLKAPSSYRITYLVVLWVPCFTWLYVTPFLSLPLWCPAPISALRSPQASKPFSSPFFHKVCPGHSSTCEPSFADSSLLYFLGLNISNCSKAPLQCFCSEWLFVALFFFFLTLSLFLGLHLRPCTFGGLGLCF